MKGRLKQYARNTAKTLLYGWRGTSELYIKHLKRKGVKIGEGTKIHDPRTTRIDVTRPYLVEIGNDVNIAAGVTILTHGFDWIVLRRKYKQRLGSAGRVKLKNNIFIGMNATILMGVTVGNNVIIGANSLVSKDVPDNVVVAGNPARVIMTIDEYYEKKQKRQIEGAKELAYGYYERYNKKPPISIYTNQFSDIFTKSDDNPNPMYNSYDEFLKDIGINV